MKVSEVPQTNKNPSQNSSSSINLVDSIPSVEVYSMKAAPMMEVNATKRASESTAGPSRPPPNLRTTLGPHSSPLIPPPVSMAPPPIPSASGYATPTGPRVTFATPPVTQTAMGTPPTTNIKKVTRRKPVRRLPISVRRHDVWSKLDKVDAGLSLTEWLMLDPRASLDLMDGVRTMRSKRKKYSDGGEGRQVVSVNPNPRTRSKDNPMVIGSIEQWDDGSSDWEDSVSMDTSEFTEETSESVQEDDGMIGTSVPYDFHDNGSQEEYPYSLSALRKSAPLKGPVSVNGIVFECTFDSGAAVSVMSEALAVKLGLEYNGDQIHLTSFDSQPREPCNIVQRVPIRVGGHLRSEHMCIQPSRQRAQDEYCILGMTWFRNYGASIKAQENVVVFPVTVNTRNEGNLVPDWSAGAVEVQCYSSHDGDGIQSFSSKEVTVDDSSQASQVLAVAVSSIEQVNSEETTEEFYGQGLTTYLEEVVNLSNMETTSGEPVDWQKVPDWLQELVKNYRETFVEVSGLGRVKEVHHVIPTSSTEPIRSRPFRLTWEEQEQLAAELDDMLRMDLIRPSNGTWSSPCFFIRKKEGSLRLVIDYRRLNKLTIKDTYPLPMIDTVLDSMAGATVFSTLDAASGYHQVPMDSNSIDKTGFITPLGTYEFKVMPFGLTSAPATYQRMMANLLGRFLYRFAMVFIDDVIVYSKTREEHLIHLKLVMEEFKKAKLKLKFKKCKFGASMVEYLGHTISADGVSPHAHNVDKILGFPTPRNADHVRSFLGTAGYYRRFIDCYADIATPLTNMLKKNQAFQWGKEEDVAFRILQERLSTSPVLAYPDREQVQILTTDASNKGISAILSQSPDGTEELEQVVSYNSRTLRSSEENYSTVHQEALAIVWAIDKYRHYLRGRPFKLRTDNAAVAFIMTPNKPSPKLSRWAAGLMEYDFEIVHIPGILNPADSLSRYLPEDQVSRPI